MYEEKTYRKYSVPKDLFKTHLIIEESDILVFTSEKIESSEIEKKVKSLREDIKTYIKRDRNFLTTLSAYEPENSAPQIIKEMCKVSKILDVGPMACVAGAISEFLGKELLKKSKEVIVENGGDIFLKITRQRNIGIFYNKNDLLKIKLTTLNTPLGIASSSGKFGHSLSFGNCDLVCVISESAIFSDGAATFLGNLIKTQKDILPAFKKIKKYKEIKAVLVIFEGKIFVQGDLEFS